MNSFQSILKNFSEYAIAGCMFYQQHEACASYIFSPGGKGIAYSIEQFGEKILSVPFHFQSMQQFRFFQYRCLVSVEKCALLY